MIFLVNRIEDYHSPSKKNKIAGEHKSSDAGQQSQFIFLQLTIREPCYSQKLSLLG